MFRPGRSEVTTFLAVALPKPIGAPIAVLSHDAWVTQNSHFAKGPRIFGVSRNKLQPVHRVPQAGLSRMNDA